MNEARVIVLGRQVKVNTSDPFQRNYKIENPGTDIVGFHLERDEELLFEGQEYYRALLAEVNGRLRESIIRFVEWEV